VHFGKLIIALSIGTALVGCDGFRGGGTGPDEFAVVTRAPLSLPPDYGLRPPRPGAGRPNETSPRDDAQNKLLRNLDGQSRRSAAKESKKNGKFTNGESALLKRADALDVDPSIRYVVERESGRIKEEDSLVDSLVFWRDKKNPKTLVDPKEESKRLRDNAALGKSPTEGTTPIIQKK
jgi:hypothetical protein